MYKISIYNISYKDGRKEPKHVDGEESTFSHFRHMERFGAGTMK